MFFAYLSRLQCQRLDFFADQKARTLIIANDGIQRIVGLGVEFQNLLHACQKATVQRSNTPGAFEVWLQFVFLSTCPTSVWEICSQYSSSTALSASSRKLHWAYPSGGVLQASAVILARCAPSISMGRPERG